MCIKIISNFHVKIIYMIRKFKFHRNVDFKININHNIRIFRSIQNM